jgi:hypothetical protein
MALTVFKMSGATVATMLSRDQWITPMCCCTINCVSHPQTNCEKQIDTMYRNIEGVYGIKVLSKIPIDNVTEFRRDYAPAQLVFHRPSPL